MNPNHPTPREVIGALHRARDRRYSEADRSRALDTLADVAERWLAEQPEVDR